jgi:hypothetical protein
MLFSAVLFTHSSTIYSQLQIRVFKRLVREIRLRFQIILNLKNIIMKKHVLSVSLSCIIFLFTSMQAFSQANTSLSNLISTSVNQALLPNANNSLNIGSTAKSWKNLYADGKYYLDDNIFIDNNGTRNTLLGATRISSMFGTDNTIAGDSAGLKNEDGGFNVFIGGKAGYNSQGSRNTYTGYKAGSNNGEYGPGNDNCIYGYNSGSNSSEVNSGNCFFGSNSGSGSYSGGNNSYFGFKTGYTNVSAPDNSFFGSYAGYNTSDLITGGGSANSFLGSHAGYENQTGYYNSSLGYYSGQGNTTGDENLALGTYTRFGTSDLKGSTAIGSYAQVNVSNAIVLGAIAGTNGAAIDTKVGIGTASPAYRLQVENYSNDVYGVYHYFRPGSTNSHYGFYNYMSSINSPTGQLTGLFNIVNVPSANTTSCYGIYSSVSGVSGSGSHYGVYSYASGGSSNWAFYSSGDSYATGFWQSSDERLKKNIIPVENAIDRLMQLKPRSYDFKTDEYDFMHLPAGKQYGFIAQELEKVFPEMVREIEQPKSETKEKDGQPQQETADETFTFKGVNYQMMIPVLTEAIQEQQKQIEALKAELDQLKKSNDVEMQGREQSAKADVQVAALLQNVPNPASGNTSIGYSLPASFSNAEIRVTDVHGLVLKTISLPGELTGQIEIATSGFMQGTYYYSLFVNGNIVASRQLVVVH